MRSKTVARGAAAAMTMGMAMNTLCWGVNGGMPVANWAKAHDWSHHLATRRDMLPWLWDRIHLPFGLVASMGDFVLAAGFLLLTYTLLVRWLKSPRVRLSVGGLPWLDRRGGVAHRTSR